MSNDIVATLRLWARNANEQGVTTAVNGLKAAADEIERLRAERDEARREVCELDADTSEDQRAYAAQRGWDCFDTDTKENT